MLIAIAADGSRVSAHFGRCEKFALYEVDPDAGSATFKEDALNPGHAPGVLPKFLAEKGVAVVVAGGMGPRAQALFADAGIKVVVGASGSTADVATAFASGALSVGDSTCDHAGPHGHGGGRCDGHGGAHRQGGGHHGGGCSRQSS